MTSITQVLPRYIKIVGQLNTVPYQRAKYYAKTFAVHLPDEFRQPELVPYLDVDWSEFLLKHRRRYGGIFYELDRSVICYVNDYLVGDDEDLVAYLTQHYQISPTVDFYQEALKDFKYFLQKEDRMHVFLMIAIDSVFVGCLIFTLYNDLVPKTCANFLRLATRKKHGYAKSPVHRICVPSWIQFGGWNLRKSQDQFPCENYIIPHDRRGVLSMCHHGKHKDNSTQCFITLNPAPWMDQKYVAFGQLIIGDEVLQKIENVKTFYEYPLQKIHICQSGIYSFYQGTSRREQKYMECLLREGVDTLVSPSGKEKKQFRMPRDVLDIRDVPSDFKIQRYVDRLYCFEQDRGPMIWPYPILSKTTLTHLEDVDFHLSRAKTAKTVTRTGKVVETAKYPPDVLDPRDVESVLSMTRYNQGLYYFELDVPLEEEEEEFEIAYVRIDGRCIQVKRPKYKKPEFVCPYKI